MFLLSFDVSEMTNYQMGRMSKEFAAAWIWLMKRKSERCDDQSFEILILKNNLKNFSEYFLALLWVDQLAGYMVDNQLVQPKEECFCVCLCLCGCVCRCASRQY